MIVIGYTVDSTQQTDFTDIFYLTGFFTTTVSYACNRIILRITIKDSMLRRPLIYSLYKRAVIENNKSC